VLLRIYLLFLALLNKIYSSHSESLSWLPILGDFFIHHFFPALTTYDEVKDFTDVYSCRQVSKWFRQHLKPPRVRLTSSKFRGFSRMSAIAPIVQKLICINFSDGINMSRFVESPFFTTAKSLRTLRFEDCQDLKSGAVGMLFANISKLESLRELDLASSGVDAAGFAAIAKSSVPCSTIVTLHLPFLKYGQSDNGPAMATVICKFTALECLSLFTHSSNFTGMFESISKLKKLTHLKLKENNRQRVVNHSLSDVASMLRKLHQLTSLKMTIFCMPEDADFVDLVNAIDSHPSLTSLSTRLLPPGAAAVLSKALSHNTVLKSLDFRDCHLSDIDMCCISLMLQLNKTITSLNLSSNVTIQNEVFKTFGHALARNSSLRWLDISGIQGLGLEPKRSTAQALATHKSLSVLNMGMLYPACINALGDSLAKNTSLVKLLLSSPLSQADVGAFWRGVAKNSTLRSLTIFGFHFHLGRAQQVVDAILQNRELVVLHFESCTFTRPANDHIITSLVQSSRSVCRILACRVSDEADK
jgi:hypothetical protein